MNALTVASKDQFFEQLADAFAKKITKTEAKRKIITNLVNFLLF